MTNKALKATHERQPDPGQQWKLGDEFLPFHPQASHVPAEYRDGWNRCFWMAVGRTPEASPAPPQVTLDPRAVQEMSKPDWYRR